jgi:hypothetical protein
MSRKLKPFLQNPSSQLKFAAVNVSDLLALSSEVVPELLRVEINCMVLGSGAVVSGQSSTTNREFSGRKYSPKL